ncbi:MAG: hypothetical protein EOO52_06130 [Gammaproteobacteria bacterium]|nr:MAG: hypothetical protein EOO52_06130 [Gammaproteobacteria bacterium]
MNFLKYWLCLTIVFYSGCSGASSKDTQTLACPNFLSSEKSLPSSWITVGKIPNEKFLLRTIGLIYPEFSDLDKRNFSEEMIDEWEELEGRSQSIAEYDKDHKSMMMKCVYARSFAEDSDSDSRNVVLLIPLPQEKPVKCVLVRRDIDPTHEISCKVK